jgi:hypothetical protein
MLSLSYADILKTVKYYILFIDQLYECAISRPTPNKLDGQLYLNRVSIKIEDMSTIPSTYSLINQIREWLSRY